jgi:mono/diheme cytochrome c family protein
MKTAILGTAVFAGVLFGAASRPLLERAPPSYAERQNPLENLAAATKAGEKLYRRECSSCHGKQAQGSTRAPSLNSPAIRRAPDGAIFWVLRNGSLRHGMPSFAHLPEPERWQIIAYLRTATGS